MLYSLFIRKTAMATVFEMIIAGDIPSTKLYEDDICLAILDIAPKAKGHTLVISKKVYETVSDAPADTIAHMFEIVKRIDARMRKELGADGTNVFINNSPASGQEVPHLHIHVIPRHDGDGLSFFPPSEKYGEGEMQEYGRRLSI